MSTQISTPDPVETIGRQTVSRWRLTTVDRASYTPTLNFTGQADIMSRHSRDTYPRLLGDIGGTNARFALLSHPNAAISDMRSLSASAFPGPAEAINAYLAKTGGVRARVAAFGIANPIDGDRVEMTNHTWSFSIEALRRQLDLQHLLVINDFTALALSLPYLPADELHQVGGGTRQMALPIAVLGAGTGLGVSGLLPAGERYLPLAGEGGHVTLAATTAEEAAVIEQLRTTFVHVSAERLLSGPGLVNLYDALARVRQQPVASVDAATITHAALASSDTLAVDTLNMFCALLGTVAGNLALTLGAKGGVFIGGGIVPRLGKFFDRSPFRQRFEDKGRFRAYLAGIPVFVIHAPYPAISGAAVALAQAVD